MQRAVSFVGIFAFLTIAWLVAEKRRRPDWRLLAWGLGLQFIFALLVLGVPALGWSGPLRFVFDAMNGFVTRILDFSIEGARFVFGPLADPVKSGGFIFAVLVLPSIIFFSALVAALYHVGIMQKFVRAVAWVMVRTMRTSGAESLASAANIFLGQTEAPLAVKPYVPLMTRSELFAVMVGGMANVAGGVLAAYVGLLKGRLPDIAGHLITVSVMSAPGSLLIAKLMVPELEKPVTSGQVKVDDETRVDRNVLEAISRGAAEGLALAFNVAAMLIAFIAFVALVNAGCKLVGEWANFAAWGGAFVPTGFLKAGEAPSFSLELVFGWLFAPIAWLMGIPWSEAPLIGNLLGQKVVLNEFVAFLSLTDLSGQLSDRTVIVTSYALCGFANFASIGIQIGGIGAMAPERRGDIASLGLRAVLAGSLSTFLAAAIAGVLL